MDKFDTAVNETLAMIRADKLDPHAQEIGRICVLWGRLEVFASSLLRALLEIKDPTTNNVLLGELDLRAKIRCMLPLGFSKKPSMDWFNNLQKTLNVIDNDLRNERNRTIHDHWAEMPGSGVTRIQIVAKLVNDQREKKVTLANFKPVTIDDLKAFQVRIAIAIGELSELLDDYEMRLASLQKRLPPIPPESPSQDQTPEAE